MFVFRTAPQTLDTVYTQMLQGERLYTSDTKPVKQERINLLQRMLMEYAPTGRECEPGQAQNRLNILLDAHCSLSDYSRANLFYQQGLTLAQEIDNRLGEANCLKAIGDVQIDSQQSLEQFLQPALEIYQQIGDVYSQGRILADSIAPTYLKLQQPDQAKLSYEQALAFWSQIGYESGIQQCQNALQTLN